MSAPHEIELKLEIDGSAEVGRARRAMKSALPVGGDTRRLVSRYFDTADHRLRGRGLSLRVRQDGKRRIQTLKRDGDGLFARPEWESEIVGDDPDLSALTDARRRREIEKLGPLAAVFETSVDRTIWRVRRGRSRIEVALDQGEVAAAGRVAPIDEIELELKAGSAAALFAVGRDLVAACPVKVGMSSKAERGYALASRRHAGAIKAEAVKLDPDGTAGLAFQAIARACIRHFFANEPRVVQERAPEALHQSRVAIRRLRSAFALFRDVIASDESRRLTGQLRALSRALGEARNLDVYLARTLVREGKREPFAPGLADLRAKAQDRRELAYDGIARRSRSRRLRCLMVDLVAFVETGSWLADENVAGPRDEPVAIFSTRILTRRRRKVKRSGRHLAKLDGEARHQVRIDAKKLRYASEFFESLVEGRGAKRRWTRFVASLEDLQTCLGDLNDLATGHEMALSLARPGARDATGDLDAVAFAAGHVSGEDDSREAELVVGAAKAHRAFRDAEPFWR